MNETGNRLKTPSLPSVPRALEVLERIAASQNGLALTQVTRLLGYPRSTVHCLLLTLERSGYIQRTSARGPYLCGSRLLTLSSKVLVGATLRQAAMPILRSLLHRTHLTVHLAMLERDQVTVIAQLASPGSGVMTSIGSRLEIHCTALGKAIAAYLPPMGLSTIMQGRTLTPHNEKTIVSLRKFNTELATTRQRGYAVDDEEDAIGYRCVAAPVLDAGNMPAAAVSVVGSTCEIADENVASLASELIKTAGEISDWIRAQ
jgi:DNA-binding IclR family transcriptional regulator